MTDPITCPSGLAGTLRPMKVREERALADRKGSPVDELLTACWTATADAGPYTFEGEKPDWGRVLQGDRFFALLQLRALTYGPEYAFKIPCAACKAQIAWEVSLLDLPVRSLSPESRKAFLADNRFPATLPIAGKRVWFKLLVGADEAKLTRLRKTAGDRMLSVALGHRIVDVEGVDARDRRTFIEDLSMRDAQHLLKAFQAADCGVETSFEVECQECGAEREVELPFGAGFFLPST